VAKQLFALASDQGTACSETCLCSDHYTDENKGKIEAKIDPKNPDRAVAGSWHDCTENEALACTDCGYAPPPPIDPQQPAFLRVPVKCLPTVIAALKSAGFEAEAKAVEDFTRDYTDPEANAERLEWLAKADEEAKDGEVEFDSDATISHSEGGQYVLGWVWVYGEEEDGLKSRQNA
jgi:hypothetical protein